MNRDRIGSATTHDSTSRAVPGSTRPTYAQIAEYPIAQNAWGGNNFKAVCPNTPIGFAAYPGRIHYQRSDHTTGRLRNAEELRAEVDKFEPGMPLILDLEHRYDIPGQEGRKVINEIWEARGYNQTLSISNGDFTRAQIAGNVDWVKRVCGLYRKAGWAGPLLLYGMPCALDYWLGVFRQTQPSSAYFKRTFAMLRDANRKACDALLPHVDGVVLKPQYFYRGDDSSKMSDPFSAEKLRWWEESYRFNVALCRNLCPGAKVWTHLWPRFHDSAKPVVARWRRTDDGISLRRTQVAWEVSDALVYWDRPAADTFDPESYWWKVAEEYAVRPVSAGLPPVNVQPGNAAALPGLKKNLEGA